MVSLFSDKKNPEASIFRKMDPLAKSPSLYEEKTESSQQSGVMTKTNEKRHLERM
jgi:hypothetical protein